ncbi:uncharacterized protein PV09_02777 [Verruconis gallopava]|uniref:Uncharacterized protein n=1 Tax=Verruconis gallopava TaxID=253628 RepID=A0A0D1Z028_9PEZI|nr:uncharacterized protein PV09_02777 [Verruconis gallopava]KIW06312.1 hypothetical protein PV09_02777 [Verruconis gallopava]
MGGKKRSRAARNRRQNVAFAAQNNIKTPEPKEEKTENDASPDAVVKSSEGKLRMDSVTLPVQSEHDDGSPTTSENSEPEETANTEEESKREQDLRKKQHRVSRFGETFDDSIAHEEEQSPTSEDAVQVATAQVEPECDNIDESMIHPALRKPSKDAIQTTLWLGMPSEPAFFKHTSKPQPSNLSVPNLAVINSNSAPSKASSTSASPPLKDPCDHLQPRRARSLEIHSQLQPSSGLVPKKLEQHALHTSAGQKTVSEANVKKPSFTQTTDGCHATETQEAQSVTRASDSTRYLPRLSFQQGLEEMSRTPPNFNLHDELAFLSKAEGHQTEKQMLGLNVNEAQQVRKQMETEGVQQMNHGSVLQQRDKKEQHRDERQSQKSGVLARLRSWMGTCIHFGGGDC